MNKILISMAKGLVKDEIKAFFVKQFASKTYQDFKARVIQLSPEQIFAAFESWIPAQVDKY